MDAQALKAQGDQFWEQGDLDSAIQCYEDALKIKPDFFQAHANLGSVLAKNKNFDTAIKHYEEAIALQPDIAALYSNTAEILNQALQYEQAEQFARVALERQPDFIPALNNLGIALTGLERMDEAQDVLLHAKDIAPDSHEVWSNLGDCYRINADYKSAKICYLRAIELNPGIAIVHHKLSIIHGKLGDYIQYISAIRQALSLDKTLRLSRSNLLFMLNTRGTLPLEEMHKEFLLWDEIHGEEGRANSYTHTRSDTAKQKLRIGYLSPDFRVHSVSFFFESIIKNHDKAKYEIYCYANVAEPDHVTERLQGHADCWRDIYSLPDKEIAELIYNDKIDILIDLAGHTGYNRLAVFTYKPAPIQATYLGGATTTGLRAMDYWITDAIIHPENTREPSSEEKYRLPRCFYSYTPPPGIPDVLPESLASQPTFGSFNDFRKLTERTIEIWSAVLKKVPESVMLLKHRSLQDDEKQSWILEQFRTHQIDTSRIHFAGHTENHSEHFDQYNNIDVALDPFPFTGATTTIDTLWMGVPTVTLAGDTMASRYSASFLHAVGLDDLIANTLEEYVAIAKNLIADKDRLTTLRKSLRTTMQNSELCDGAGLTKALQDFYQDAWSRYCQSK